MVQELAMSYLAFRGSRNINGALFFGGGVPYLCHFHKETENGRHITIRNGVTETNHFHCCTMHIDSIHFIFYQLMHLYVS